jgi:hypothetical protein
LRAPASPPPADKPEYANKVVFTAPAVNLGAGDGFRNTQLLNFTVPATFDTVNFWGVRRVTITVSSRAGQLLPLGAASCAPPPAPAAGTHPADFPQADHLLVITCLGALRRSLGCG